jgi:PAS domain S-box-containing protein
MEIALITTNGQGIIQAVDKNCCKMFGYELEELMNQPIYQIMSPPYKEQHKIYMQNYKPSKGSKKMDKSRIVETVHKDGHCFPVKLTITTIGPPDEDYDTKCEDNGKPYKNTVFVGMFHPVEEKLASITMNSSGVIVSCDQLIEELLGYKTNELIGLP